MGYLKKMKSNPKKEDIHNTYPINDSYPQYINNFCIVVKKIR
jgi:hypothetical protein